MVNLFAAASASGYVWGNKNFGFKWYTSHPAISVFGFDVYLYALAIVTGMCLAILIAAHFFKKRGYDPYDITIYAIAVIPLGVLGARAYVYIFPWSGRTSDWSTFFDFRSGGLGIYGGVIVGYIAAYVVSKIKKQDFRIIADAIIPGVMLAQCLGRWGNFFNQEAYGNLVSTNYNDFFNLWSIFGGTGDHGFNGLYVWIDAAHGYSTGGAGWYQATFFYESFCNLIGFLICMLVLTRSKKYKLGWCTSFYGIYYGIVRLVIEGMRTDSLYLYIGTIETDIRISQLVSVCTIAFGLWTISKIYRKQIHSLYSKMFKSEKDEVAKSRWIVTALAVVSLAVAVVMFVLGGASKLLLGIFCVLLCAYCVLGVISLNDRLKLYCNACGKRNQTTDALVSEPKRLKTAVICYSVATGLLIVVALFSAIKWGAIDNIDNGYVLCVVCLLAAFALGYAKLLPTIKQLINLPNQNQEGEPNFTAVCDCGCTYDVTLNPFLLFVFPPKVYVDYGVEGLTEYVEKPKEQKPDSVTEQ